MHAEVFEETYFDPMFNVLALAVDSSVQKKGIGSQLMHTLEKQAKNLGMKEIRLNSGESRLGAHKFYENWAIPVIKCRKDLVKP
ncbi:GNAT family N-acetyltransferase [Lactobacillus sp. R2/2]|nr:GNAT family N-acetyltransferase [Lactobacillus sp. R2/2]